MNKHQAGVLHQWRQRISAATSEKQKCAAFLLLLQGLQQTSSSDCSSINCPGLPSVQQRPPLFGLTSADNRFRAAPLLYESLSPNVWALAFTVGVGGSLVSPSLGTVDLPL